MAVAVWTSFQQISNSTTAGTTPYAGAKVNVYAAGTTTPLSVFSDKDLLSAAANPIICDSSGQHAMRYIATANYKTSVADSSDNPLSNWSKDNIDPGVAIGSGALPIANGGTSATTAAAARTALGVPSTATVTTIASDVATLQTDVAALEANPLGQCQLTKSGATLLLSPYNGNRITINSTYQTIPDAGVSLAVGALGNSTLYYIYAYMSGATMTLEGVTTAYATQAGTGVKIKSGDATRTLVGMAYLLAGAFVDSATQRFVRSWFNDPGVSTSATFTANRTYNTVAFAEGNTEIKNEFLSWTGEIVDARAHGGFVSAGDTSYLSIGFNGTTAEATSNRFTSVSVASAFSVGVRKTGLTEGYNYATILGKAASSSMIVSGSATAGEASNLTLHIRH
jgi:hypothetical protein